MLFFGQVREMEVTRERAGNELGPLMFPAGDEGHARRREARIAAGPDDQPAQLFH